MSNRIRFNNFFEHKITKHAESRMSSTYQHMLIHQRMFVTYVSILFYDTYSNVVKIYSLVFEYEKTVLLKSRTVLFFAVYFMYFIFCLYFLSVLRLLFQNYFEFNREMTIFIIIIYYYDIIIYIWKIH